MWTIHRPGCTSVGRTRPNAYSLGCVTAQDLKSSCTCGHFRLMNCAKPPPPQFVVASLTMCAISLVSVPRGLAASPTRYVRSLMSRTRPASRTIPATRGYELPGKGAMATHSTRNRGVESNQISAPLAVNPTVVQSLTRLSVGKEEPLGIGMRHDGDPMT